MKTWRVVAAATTTAALATVLCAVGPVAAQDQPDLLPISVEPSTVTVGDSVTVSGADCLTETGDPGDVHVDIFSEGSEEPVSFAADVNEDGTWSLVLVAEEADVGVHDVTATCFVSPESNEVVAEYDFALLTVNPASPPTTPPTTPPVLTPVAPPATPVSGSPTFTG